MFLKKKKPKGNIYMLYRYKGDKKKNKKKKKMHLKT